MTKAIPAGAHAMRGLSGGAFHPAVTAGFFLAGKQTVSQVGTYIAVQLASGVAAGTRYKAISPDQPTAQPHRGGGSRSESRSRQQ